MKYYKFKIKIYDWDIFYIEVESRKDEKVVEKKLKSLGLTKKLRKFATNEIKDGAKDGGECFNNAYKRWSIIVLYQSRNYKNKIEILSHEKRHVEDSIINQLNLECREARAHIAGYIAKKLSRYIKK